MDEAQPVKRLIEVPDDLKFVAVREEYLAICDGEACPAALLNLFERFSLWKQEQGYSEPEWVYMTRPEMMAALLNLWGLTWLRRWLDWLEAVGFIQRRRDPKHPMDAQGQYCFDADAVQAAVTNAFVTKCAIDSSVSDECIQQAVTNAVASLWQMHYAERDEWKRQFVADASGSLWRMILLDSFLDFVLRLLSENPSSSSPETAGAGFEEHPLLRLAEGQAPDDDDDEPAVRFTPEKSLVQKPEISVYALYAENIEALTPVLRDKLIDAVQDYGEEALRAAIVASVEQGVRKWKYVKACLEGRPRAADKGRKNGRAREPDEQDGRRYVGGKYAEFIQH